MHVLSTIRPTENQKRVLAKIISSPTPTVAGDAISSGQGIVAARNMLMKLGLITLTNGTAAVTDRGTQVATAENIIDQGGQLTTIGKELAFSKDSGEADTEAQKNSPMESFALIRELIW